MGGRQGQDWKKPETLNVLAGAHSGVRPAKEETRTLCPHPDEQTCGQRLDPQPRQVGAQLGAAGKVERMRGGGGARG